MEVPFHEVSFSVSIVSLIRSPLYTYMFPLSLKEVVFITPTHPSTKLI